MVHNNTEKETISLCISLEAIETMINYELLYLKKISVNSEEVEIYFHTRTHQELFIIRLLDFAKESGDSRITGVRGSCLSALQSACNICSFNQGNSIKYLENSVKELDIWLKHKTKIKLWLPTISIEVTIELDRLDLIAILGNYCKHNLSRLTGISQKIHSILDNNGYSIEIDQIPLALNDFREHLQENYFIHYGTWLCEMLNNIRWGIQDYLYPIYSASYTKDSPNDIRYRYVYPTDIINEIPKSWFWRLMNNIRKGPYCKKFTAVS